MLYSALYCFFTQEMCHLRGFGRLQSEIIYEIYFNNYETHYETHYDHHSGSYFCIDFENISFEKIEH